MFKSGSLDRRKTDKNKNNIYTVELILACLNQYCLFRGSPCFPIGFCVKPCVPEYDIDPISTGEIHEKSFENFSFQF